MHDFVWPGWRNYPRAVPNAAITLIVETEEIPKKRCPRVFVGKLPAHATLADLKRKFPEHVPYPGEVKRFYLTPCDETGRKLVKYYTVDVDGDSISVYERLAAIEED